MDNLLLDVISNVAKDYNIIINENEGLTEISPSVIMFYGVAISPLKRGHGRQLKYIALYDRDYYRIEQL